MRWRLAAFGLSLALLTTSCGSKVKYAPVSGRVTLDGKPLANGYVYFQPVAEAGKAVADAPGSSGKTNENGEYVLKNAEGREGAWVGKHQVRIDAHAPQVGEGDERPPRGGWPLKNKVPTKYNEDSKEFYEVPPDGTDKANFDLKSK
jgi:hypothetical protein